MYYNLIISCRMSYMHYTAHICCGHMSSKFMLTSVLIKILKQLLKDLVDDLCVLIDYKLSNWRIGQFSLITTYCHVNTKGNQLVTIALAVSKTSNTNSNRPYITLVHTEYYSELYRVGLARDTTSITEHNIV